VRFQVKTAAYKSLFDENRFETLFIFSKTPQTYPKKALNAVLLENTFDAVLSA